MTDIKGKRNLLPVEEYSEVVLNVRRVAKVIKGGRRFAFSALVVVGDKKGSIGISLGKSREVSSAISKALKRAKKNMLTVPEQIEDIIRRSCVNTKKNSEAQDNVDDAFLKLFSRKTSGRPRKN